MDAILAAIPSPDLEILEPISLVGRAHLERVALDQRRAIAEVGTLRRVADRQRALDRLGSSAVTNETTVLRLLNQIRMLERRLATTVPVPPEDALAVAADAAWRESGAALGYGAGGPWSAAEVFALGFDACASALAASAAEG